MPTQNESTGRGDSSPFGGFIAKDNAIAYGVNGSILHWHGGGVRVRPHPLSLEIHGTVIFQIPLFFSLTSRFDSSPLCAFQPMRCLRRESARSRVG